MSNMTYSLVYQWLPKSEGRKAFIQTAGDISVKYAVSVIMGKDDNITLAGMVKDEVAPILRDTGLLPNTDWPKDIVTCRIETPLPLYAVGMDDGWEIFIADNVFIGFVTDPDDAIQTLDNAGQYYTINEKFETLPELVERVGIATFRREILGTKSLPDPTSMPVLNSDDGYEMDFSQDYFFEPAQIRPVKEGEFVRPEDNLMAILMTYPEMGHLFMEYGMHCFGCTASYNESLWEACQVHGLDVFELLGEINEYLADKYGKELIHGDTKLQELFTMYPQTLAVLNDYQVEMPSDMEMTLETLTTEQNISLRDLLEQIGRVLRKE